MAVAVVTAREVAEHFYTGEKWHIDETGKLHVMEANGKHIGAFAHGQWAYVIEDEATKSPEVGGGYNTIYKQA